MLYLNKYTFSINKAILISLPVLLLPTAIATVTAADAPVKIHLAQSLTSAIEPAILAEINRARTQPQAYADWLEAQQQYYDGALLKLPGETPLRTNRGFKALQEAIAFLRQQQPRSPLTSSQALSNKAQTQLEEIANFATGVNISVENISYGLMTPEAIVMQLIVDDRFPDRRRRRSLFSPQLEATGIVCQPDERYGNICAIAYEPGSEAIATNTSPDVEPENATANSNTLPQPPTQPSLPEPTDNENEDLPADTNSTPDAGNSAAEAPDSEALPATEGIEIEVPPATTTASEVTEPDPEASAGDRNTAEIATTQERAQLLEKVERGTLEAGDKTIPEDGSFYDSYPLEAQAGDSFIISLESEEFDTFVAILDAEGNIIEQNDDISDNNSNSRLRVTLPDSGIYSVIVNAYDEGGTGSYVLSIRR